MHLFAAVWCFIWVNYIGSGKLCYYFKTKQFKLDPAKLFEKVYILLLDVNPDCREIFGEV